MSFLKKWFRKSRFEHGAEDAATRETITGTEGMFPPLKGRIIPISKVPDPAFAQKMMGDGYAIIPESSTVRSPVDGTVSHLFPTKHAISVRSDDGREILIHIGVGTVSLKGRGFDTFVGNGTRIKQGDPLIKVDFKAISKKVPSTVTSVIFTNLKDNERVVINGDKVFIRPSLPEN